MPRNVFVSHPNSEAYAANGSISLELAPKPMTITRMVINVRADITTTAAPGTYNDPWDRIISRLSLTGNNKTFFDVSSPRALYHGSRFRGFAPRRPTAIAASQTNALQQFQYILHFGLAPWKLDPITGMLQDNPYDLTAGIPPVSSGNLSLQGNFASGAAPGSGWTVNDADFEVYIYGVQPKEGESNAAVQPRAFPRWEMQTPTPTSTSTAFASSHNVPAGDFLHALLLMSTNGSNDPRDDGVLSDLRVYNTLESRDVWKADRYKAAEIATQRRLVLAPPSDDGSTLGVPSLAAVSDKGLVYLPLHEQAVDSPLPQYGADLRGVSTGDIQLQYGVADATGVTLNALYFKYSLNPEHPENVGR